MVLRITSGLAAVLDIRLVWILISAVLTRAATRRYLTSIRGIPGPFLASFSSLWQVYHLFKGHTEEEIIKLHKKHGASLAVMRHVWSHLKLTLTGPG